MQILNIHSLEIELTRKAIKNIHLKICAPNGAIRVSAPHKTAEKIIIDFVEAKLPWIIEKQFQVRDRSKHLLETAPLYRDGDLHYIFGQAYALQIKTLQKSYLDVVLTEHTLDLYVREVTTPMERETLIKAWSRHILKQKIAAIIKHYEPIMQVQITEFGVKQMKTKWGTCNVQARRIWLNLELIKYPLTCLEYVVVHEMAHILEASHNEHFWNLVRQFMPTWQEAKARLEAGVKFL